MKLKFYTRRLQSKDSQLVTCLNVISTHQPSLFDVYHDLLSQLGFTIVILLSQWGQGYQTGVW